MKQHDDRPVDDQVQAPETDVETATEPSAGERPDEGPVRRSLIRASLKPGEGLPPQPRAAPVFTMHQPPPRPAGRPGRPNRDNGNQNGNGLPRRQRNDRGGQSRSNSRRGKGRSR
jgi:hypothetical protein